MHTYIHFCTVPAALSAILSLQASHLTFGQAGTLDASFGVGGLVVDIPSSSGQSSPCIVHQADGRILIGGSSPVAQDGAVVMRYMDDGSLDPTFGVGGIATTGLPAGYFGDGRALAVEVGDDGGILVVLFLLDSPNGYFNPSTLGAIARLLPNGSLDVSYGVNGFAVLPVIPNVFVGGMYLIEVAPTGGVVVAGKIQNTVAGDSRAVVARVAENGSLDPTFGQGGYFTASLDVTGNLDIQSTPGWGLFQTSALVLQDDGKILVGGGASVVGHAVGAVVRLLPDGQLDPSFGSGGLVTSIGLFSESFWLGALSVDSLGRVLLGGEKYAVPFTPATDFLAVARLLPDGTPDATFGSGGQVTTSVSSTEWEWIDDLAVDANNNITAIGSAHVDPTRGYDFALVRYLADGALDPAFGTAGVTLTDLGGDDFGTSISVDTLGRIVAVGYAPDTTFGSVLGIARYHGVTAPPEVLLEWLVDDVVLDLVTTELVTNGEANSLQSKLQGSIQMLDQGHQTPAINKLEAFINQLGALVNSGRLNPGEAQPLIDQAQFVISVVDP